MNIETIKQAHKVMVKISIKHMAEMYNLLNVKADNYDPESWYGGVPHPITGEVLADSKCIVNMISGLFLSIAHSKPICKQEHGNSFIVWPEGDNQPTYTHHKNGIGFLSNKEYDCHHLDKNEKHHYCGKSKGKLLDTGEYGLGVLYHTACVLWGEKIVDSLPLKSEDMI